MGKLVRGVNDLASSHPDLTSEWHPSKNRNLTPREVASSTNKKVWWLCSQGHEWEATPNDRHRGTGCPVCAGRSVLRGFNDLATTNPTVATEWHPTKNGVVSPYDVTSGSHGKAWWLCSQGHEWEASIRNRHNGRGCPICAGKRVLVGFNDLGTTNPTVATEWHPTKNVDLTPRDVVSGTNKKAWWLCPQGHEWQASIRDRHNGRGCPYCSGRFAIVGETDMATTNPDLAREWHPTRNGDVTPQDVKAGANKKAWWLCSQGHEWASIINSRRVGTGCPVCAGNQILIGSNDLETTNPRLAGEWHPTKNVELTPRDVMSGTHMKVWWLCAGGHEWEATIGNRHRGSGCPYCAGQRLLKGINDLVTTKPWLAREWHPTKNGDVTPRDVTSGTNKKAWWLCPQGHEWQASIASRRTGSGCPRCAKSGYDQTSPGYLYLLRKEHLDLQQFGITNYPEDRLQIHRRSGWELLDVMGPADGLWIVETETALGHFFKAKGLLLPRDYPDKFDGFSESWRSHELSFSTCAEMLEALRDWEW
jgi:hypothetical protein